MVTGMKVLTWQHFNRRKRHSDRLDKKVSVKRGYNKYWNKIIRCWAFIKLLTKKTKFSQHHVKDWYVFCQNILWHEILANVWEKKISRNCIAKILIFFANISVEMELCGEFPRNQNFVIFRQYTVDEILQFAKWKKKHFCFNLIQASMLNQCVSLGADSL